MNDNLAGALATLLGMAGALLAAHGPVDFMRRSAPYLFGANVVLFVVHAAMWLAR